MRHSQKTSRARLAAAEANTVPAAMSIPTNSFIVHIKNPPPMESTRRLPFFKLCEIKGEEEGERENLA
jgi:hypothetical protein